MKNLEELQKELVQMKRKLNDASSEYINIKHIYHFDGRREPDILEPKWGFQAHR